MALKCAKTCRLFSLLLGMLQNLYEIFLNGFRINCPNSQTVVVVKQYFIFAKHQKYLRFKTNLNTGKIHSFSSSLPCLQSKINNFQVIKNHLIIATIFSMLCNALYRLQTSGKTREVTLKVIYPTYYIFLTLKLNKIYH